MAARLVPVDEKGISLQHRSDQAFLRVSDGVDTQNYNPDLEEVKQEALYGKGLVHDEDTKLPDLNQIRNLKYAVEFGTQDKFDVLELGGTRKLVDPQASLAFEMSGSMPAGHSMPACPTLNSSQAACEMLEVYEKALLRDTPFNQIESGVATGVSRAVDMLNSFGSDFKGPKASNSGLVTSKTLFRGKADGCTIGPYVSQFLLRDVPIGAHTITQKYNYEQGVYGITESDWFEIQKGNVPVAQMASLAPKYICNGRGLGSFVHVDFVYQAYYYALAILLGMGADLDLGYTTLANEDPFTSRGGPAELAASVGEVARHALRAAWVQKWRHNLRLRPETMAHRVYAQSLDNGLGYVHANMYSKGAATLAAVSTANGGNYLLPLQYAEGSPTHPAYPAGHAVLSGACATYLKIVFKDEQAWSSLSDPSVVHCTDDGESLTAYTTGSTVGMTVGTELNKLAANISIGRNIAGVHYRSDGDEGMNLGEKVAIAYVKDQLSTYNQGKPALTLKKFDGTTVEI